MQKIPADLQGGLMSSHKQLKLEYLVCAFYDYDWTLTLLHALNFDLL